MLEILVRKGARLLSFILTAVLEAGMILTSMKSVLAIFLHLCLLYESEKAYVVGLAAREEILMGWSGDESCSLTMAMEIHSLLLSLLLACGG